MSLLRTYVGLCLALYLTQRSMLYFLRGEVQELTIFCAIDDASGVVVLVSPCAHGSRWVGKEQRRSGSPREPDAWI